MAEAERSKLKMEETPNQCQIVESFGKFLVEVPLALGGSQIG